MCSMHKQRCRRCQRVKAVDDFHRRGVGHQTWCRACKKEHAAAHYQRNRARRRRQIKEAQDEFMAWYISLKDGPCTDCGGRFHHSAMQWDHLPGYEKLADLGTLARTGNRRRVLEEITKCELVCAN